jgi:hypothetical protein
MKYDSVVQVLPLLTAIRARPFPRIPYFTSERMTLLAIGGGSNDRQIHFFHTGIGAVLALINVFAQTTSLIWSTTKREICAAFGYA